MVLQEAGRGRPQRQHAGAVLGLPVQLARIQDQGRRGDEQHGPRNHAPRRLHVQAPDLDTWSRQRRQRGQERGDQGAAGDLQGTTPDEPRGPPRHDRAPVRRLHRGLRRRVRHPVRPGRLLQERVQGVHRARQRGVLRPALQVRARRLQGARRAGREQHGPSDGEGLRLPRPASRLEPRDHERRELRRKGHAAGAAAGLPLGQPPPAGPAAPHRGAPRLRLHRGQRRGRRWRL
mmetsp:Transcript_91036/g.257787  ORF Transcript_91036/g.257787 Transcript_91036/m.257787 type:complete len:233 (-) Transcript_91036:543-1241(-)